MTRRARLRTESTRASVVAAALAPDNTPEMETTVDDETIETTIARETTGGLRTTVDDYVVNLSVAERIAQTAERRVTDREADHDADRGETNRAIDQPRSTDDVDDTQNTNDTNP
ncbi:KEOPS complex subunit Pcc1 [Halococcus saccharolyticus]|uniref:KEOPS complex Pcc1-like subunit n=1 Tax=Halococcus saccharolyticus DSM 5350 TaxID=1227455 RepID=M0MJM8_9EURY|nr:hypothetical protein C449_06431 [Halococcus saccharolyticus DSM 5350]